MENTNIKLVIYIRANNAKSGPPLGTTLGNIGVIPLNFVKNLMNILKIYQIIFYYVLI